jgi:hypothetical protein
MIRKEGAKLAADLRQTVDQSLHAICVFAIMTFALSLIVFDAFGDLTKVQ